MKKIWQDYVEEPVESYFFGYKYEMYFPIIKCYTFFSALQTKWRNLQRHFKFIYIKVKFDHKSIPYGEQKAIYLAIHSPNSCLKLLKNISVTII